MGKQKKSCFSCNVEYVETYQIPSPPEVTLSAVMLNTLNVLNVPRGPETREGSLEPEAMIY